MQFMILLYGDESGWSKMPPEQAQSALAAFMAYNQELAASGVLVSGAQLKPTTAATTVRVRNGKVALADGPFAETKEQLGGTYVLECKNLDEALAWAQRCPAAFGGSVEVRPVMFDPTSAPR